MLRSAIFPNYFFSPLTVGSGSFRFSRLSDFREVNRQASRRWNSHQQLAFEILNRLDFVRVFNGADGDNEG